MLAQAKARGTDQQPDHQDRRADPQRREPAVLHRGDFVELAHLPEGEHGAQEHRDRQHLHKDHRQVVHVVGEDRPGLGMVVDKGVDLLEEVDDQIDADEGAQGRAGRRG